MTNGTYLGKESILAAEDLRYRDVAVPEWDGVVRVREMTAADREALNEWYQNRAEALERGDTSLSAQALLVAMCVVDADGNRIFTQDDIAALGRKSSRALGRIYDAASELSAVRRDSVEAAVKNSEASQSDGSPSA